MVEKGGGGQYDVVTQGDYYLAFPEWLRMTTIDDGDMMNCSCGMVD